MLFKILLCGMLGVATYAIIKYLMGYPIEDCATIWISSCPVWLLSIMTLVIFE